MENLEEIYVRGSNGMVSVANFATLKKGFGPVSIRRESQKRILHVTAGILTTTNANVVEQQIKDAIAESFVIPEQVIVSYEGSWSNTMSQFGFYGKIALMAILLVFGPSSTCWSTSTASTDSTRRAWSAWCARARPAPKRYSR